MLRLFYTSTENGILYHRLYHSNLDHGTIVTLNLQAKRRLKRWGGTPNANLSKGNIRLAKTIADHGQKKKVADDWQWGIFCGWSLDFRIGILEATSKIISIDFNPILFEREYTRVLNKLWITVTFMNSTQMN